MMGMIPGMMGTPMEKQSNRRISSTKSLAWAKPSFGRVAAQGQGVLYAFFLQISEYSPHLLAAGGNAGQMRHGLDAMVAFDALDDLERLPARRRISMIFMEAKYTRNSGDRSLNYPPRVSLQVPCRAFMALNLLDTQELQTSSFSIAFLIKANLRPP